jgi:hypothetical protein
MQHQSGIIKACSLRKPCHSPSAVKLNYWKKARWPAELLHERQRRHSIELMADSASIAEPSDPHVTEQQVRAALG